MGAALIGSERRSDWREHWRNQTEPRKCVMPPIVDIHETGLSGRQGLRDGLKESHLVLFSKDQCGRTQLCGHEKE